jgi:hypothetical protein
MGRTASVILLFGGAAAFAQTQPTVYFLHDWAPGPAEELASGFRAALDELSAGTRACSALH